jgi:selT/selW/selH-like putative selenoprotein
MTTTVTQARFDQGMTYAEYKAQMTRNQAQFIENEHSLTFDPSDLAFFKTLAQPLNVLVLAEDWCGDVIANLPILGRLATESGKLNVRVFLRDQNLDLMDLYLKEGKHRSIPVFVLFDQEFNELGHWIERPTRMTELVTALRDDLFATDPLLSTFSPETPFGELPEEARMRFGQAFTQFRSENRAFSDAEVVRELHELIEGTPQAAPVVPTAVTTNGTPARRPQAATAASDGPVKVSITYCAACGYEPQTLALASALMYEFHYDLAAIEIIPWQDGTFDVHVGGALVHSMMRDGGFPDNATVIAAVRAQMGTKSPA